MLIWWLLAAMLLTLAWVLLTLTRDDGTVPEAEKRFNEVLEADEGSAWLQQRRVSGMARVTRRFRRLLESLPGSDMQEIELLIRQAALMDDARRSRVYTSLWLAPVLLAALAMVIGSAKGWPLFHSAFAGLTVGYIAPRSILRNLAERRRLAIRDEMPVALNLMRLLFEAGLSLEHTLKAISEQGRQVTPNLADEFAWVLQRIQHGQERGDALEELARRLDVDELTETVSMLKQAARYGGNLRESLMRYVKMMEERRMTSLRDKVGKMSAKLSIVMMLFMFPALLLFLAGPGFLALINAFKRMS